MRAVWCDFSLSVPSSGDIQTRLAYMTESLAGQGGRVARASGNDLFLAPPVTDYGLLEYE